MEAKRIRFLIKAIYDILPNPVNLKSKKSKHVIDTLHVEAYKPQIYYYWLCVFPRGLHHLELQIISNVTNMSCEAVNKILYRNKNL